MEYRLNLTGDPAPLDGAAAPASPPGKARVTPEQEWKHRLYQQLMKRLDLTLLADLPEAEGRERIREAAQQMMAAESLPLSVAARQRIVKEIEDEILALGPLEPLLADPTVSDILVNGHDAIYVERGGKLERSEVRFYNDRHLLNIIDRIVTRVGRRIDESSPMVDARLQDGSRVNAIIPPLAIDGPMLSIRRFAVERLSGEQLESFGSIDAKIHLLLSAVVRGRLNVLISGGTGSGKTTLLNVMSGFIPAQERIITVEDSAELQLQQPHVVRLETRPPSIEGTGEVAQRELVRNTLRMRPDRIVVGEVRGAEALDMLQAMNTGHDGSMTTIHANTPRDALSRIESMVAMSGASIPPRNVRAQIASAIDIVVQLERQEDGTRRLVSFQEINGMEGEVITMSEIYRFERTGISEEGKVLGRFHATGIVPRFYEELQRRGIEVPLSTFKTDWER